MIARFARALALALPATCLALPALAQTPPPTPGDASRAEARERFDRGLTRFNDGDSAGALAEFLRAYELIPNPLVLFNVGLTYAAMGRAVEAVDALGRVLAASGALSAERLARARTVHDEQAARIASLDVTTSVPASLEIDNVAAGSTPLAAPLRVTGGVHLVGAVAVGYAPAHAEVTVASGQRAVVKLDLVPMQGTFAHVVVRTRLPGAGVYVDDQRVGRTPLAQSLTVAPGPHRVELRRDGYRTARQELTLGEGALAELSLEPDPDRDPLAASHGTLALDVSEPQASVTLDGQPRGVAADDLSVVPGIHRLLVERAGFDPVDRDVTVDPGGRTVVRVVLEPTPATRAAFVSRATAVRTWGYVGVVGGVVLAGGAVGFLVWNTGQQSQAQSDLNAAEANIKNQVGVCARMTQHFDQAACNGAALDASSRLDDANARQPWGYVGLGVGVAAAAVGAYLLVSGESPHRYDRPAPVESARVQVVPVAWPGGAGVVGVF